MKFLMFISILLLLFVWIYPAVYISQLPEVIPVHFDGKGNADGFGNKNLIWVEAGVATVLFAICSMVYLKPKMINLPEDMKKNPQAIRNFILIFCTLIMGIFAFMMYQEIHLSLGKMSSFSFPPGLIIGFIYLSLIGLMIYLGKVSNKKEEL